MQTLNFSDKENVELKSLSLKEIIDSNDTINYVYPLSTLLTYIKNNNNLEESDSYIKQNIVKLNQTFADFGIKGDIIGHKKGPLVTLYELKIQPGIKTARVINLSDDIARNMLVNSVRISTIPNKDTLGIEMPNKSKNIVCFRKLVECKEYQESTHKIPLILGCDIFANPIVVDLTTMPHLLIAGTTGSGKSVGVNGMILSILYKMKPTECKLIMIDPKMLEFSMYNDIPHLLMPVITDAKDAILALKWVVLEMENRYKKMSLIGARNIYGYNEKYHINKDEHLEYMPFIVVVIDEMADLMLVAGKEIEILIQRLSQMARAAGIHLIMATQRPSVDVITGVIKANFPTRISYQVTSKIDSRTIIGEQGAQQLLGKGDMLFLHGGGKVTRVHGPFVPDDDVEKVSNYLKSIQKPEYIDFNHVKNIIEGDDESDAIKNGNDLYSQAKIIVIEENKTSISYLQRRLHIGYNKAASFIEQMEDDGILSKPDITGKRTLLKNI